MKIVCLYGSPRSEGNSATLANRFLEEAENLGAYVKTYALNKLDLKGCQACRACKEKQDRCILKDDLYEVLEEVRDTDVLVLATPVYFGDITAQMKMFMDRTYSFLVPDFLTNPKPSRLEPGKRLVFIQSQAQKNESLFSDLFPKYGLFFELMGFNDNHLIRACGVTDPGEAGKNEKLMKLAEETAQKIMA